MKTNEKSIEKFLESQNVHLKLKSIVSDCENFCPERRISSYARIITVFKLFNLNVI